MATGGLSCRWCGAYSLVQIQGQWLYCHSCRNYSEYSSYLQNQYCQGWGHGYVAPAQGNPAAYGRKRAVLIGVSYKGHDQVLEGSTNDVLSMKKLLVERFGFPESYVFVLAEGGNHHAPTKVNIRCALRWLVQGCQQGDSLVFHYSGHGSRVRDHDRDEVDGYDECLLPLDYQTEGRILDDEINATIVRPLPTGVTLYSIIDSCFCGTLLDLPNVCRMNRDGYYKWETHHTYVSKGTSGGQAISISACDDTQNSGDSTVFTGKAMGALTYSFIKTMEQQPRISYGHLLNTIRYMIGAARRRVGLNSNDPKLSQEPILSSSHTFDINSVYFSL